MSGSPIRKQLRPLVKHSLDILLITIYTSMKIDDEQCTLQKS